MVLLQAQLVIPNVKLTTKKIVVIVIGTAIGFTGSLMLLANYWVFPVPFALTLGGLIFASFLNLCGAIALGVNDVARLKQYYDCTLQVGVQISMTGVYPVYNAVFLTLHGTSQLAFVLLLPVVKIMFKYIISKTQHGQTAFTIAICSSVDIFDVLYMSKCMQSSSTLLVGVGVIAVDLAQNYAVAFNLSRKALKLRDRFAREHNDCSHSSNLLPHVFELLKKTDRLDSQALRFASKPDFVEKESHGIRRGCSIHTAMRVQPVTARALSNSEAKLSSTAFIKAANHQLHISEEVAMVEFIETVALVFYALFLVATFHLSNTRYYQDMEGFTEAKMNSALANILIYAMLELLSMVYVHFMTKRHFGVSIFY